MQRVFIGRKKPTLPEATRLLWEQYAHGDVWDMGRVIVAVPGGQAERRLRRLLHDRAAQGGIRDLAGPNIMTPSTLLEELYQPPLRVAGSMPSYFAWVESMARASEEDRNTLAPRADGTAGAMVWAGIAREAQRARTAASAERLTLQEIAGKCADLPGVCDDKRWQALGRLEAAYLKQLAAVGLSDRDQARMEALAAGRVSCDRDIYLIGVQDLNGLDRALLSALESSVVAVVPAPEEEQDKFDATGSLRVECWEDANLKIPDAILSFVEGPPEEAETFVADIAALDGAFALGDITIGIGDEASAESLARRLAVLGVPSFSPFGRLLSRTRPGTLLGAIRDYLQAPSARMFAALARHPDLEVWLTARRNEVMEEVTGNAEAPSVAEGLLPLLTQLDIYRAECLPEILPTGEDAQKLLGSACPSRAIFARAGSLVANDAAAHLVAPLRGARRPICNWAEPILTLLQTVYADTPLADEMAGDRQFKRALTGLTEILQGLNDLPLPLCPSALGLDALAFVLEQAAVVRLPSETVSGSRKPGLEMMGWLELALDDAPVLLLTGLQEGCVPAGTGDDSLLPDSLRRTLGLADDRRRQARDGMLLRQMIETRQSGDRHVRLVVSRHGADGDPRLPSRLLFACDPEEAARRAAGFAHRPSDVVPPSLFSVGQERALRPPLPSVPNSPLTELSVSDFGDYLACPYRFYLRHVLKLDEQDDSQDEMDRRLFGTLIHDCLAVFGKYGPSEAVDVATIQAYLQAQLTVQSQRRFGAHPPPAVHLQVRQASRRLAAFAVWQAQSAKDGWAIQSDFSEKELTASFKVDESLFTIRGRLDRVDYHRGSDRYRILDYKTGDAGKGPEEKHRKKTPGAINTQWIDLQLPLYRLLLASNGGAQDKIAPDEMGYVLLSADLSPITFSDKNKRSGGSGFVRVPWSDSDHDSALECAREVIRGVRGGKFWPPTDPPPFPPSRTDPGHADVYSGLCLDSSSDRREWLGIKQEKPQ